MSSLACKEVVYPRLSRFRDNQRDKYDLSHLNEIQLGHACIDEYDCHHISHVYVYDIRRYSVTICKDCSKRKEDIHIGIY